MYKIIDQQIAGREFADGATFETLADVCEQLISYHEIDCDMTQEQKLFDAGEYEKCWRLLSDFNWRLEEVK